MTLLATWPATTDDTGTKQDGTLFSAAWSAAAKDAVEDVTHSVTNPTIDPNDITDEVVAARGNLASLDARLDLIMDNDGGLILPGTAATFAAVQSAIGGHNLVGNDTMLFWSQGDALPPDFWYLSGTGAAAARAGTGLGDANRKVGSFAAKLTYGSATASLYQALLDTGVFASADILKGFKFSSGAWVMSATANIARVYIDDGVTVTRSAAHSGSGLWEWLAVTPVALGGSATQLLTGLQLSAAGNAYLSGFTSMLADFALTRWQPTQKQPGMLKFGVAGNVAVATKVDIFELSRPAMIRDIVMRCETAPATTNILADINTWDGAAFTSIFASSAAQPVILAAATRSNRAVPNGTYARRFLSGLSGAALGSSGALSVDIDTIGTGTVGADLRGYIRVLQYQRPLEDFLAYDDL